MHWIIIIFLTNGTQAVYGMPDIKDCMTQVESIKNQTVDYKQRPVAICAQIPWGKDHP